MMVARSTLFDDFEGVLLDWRDGETAQSILTCSFPQFENFLECIATTRSYALHGAYELAMDYLRVKGIVGMDGFKYCWPEVAKDNLRRCRASARS